MGEENQHVFVKDVAFAIIEPFIVSGEKKSKKEKGKLNNMPKILYINDKNLEVLYQEIMDQLAAYESFAETADYLKVIAFENPELLTEIDPQKIFKITIEEVTS